MNGQRMLRLLAEGIVDGAPPAVLRGRCANLALWLSKGGTEPFWDAYGPATVYFRAWLFDDQEEGEFDTDEIEREIDDGYRLDDDEEELQ